MIDNQKCGFVSIVGRPNVGKSSLLNALVGERVAIVTDKPQTTRTKITGIYTSGDTQIIYMDTPGFHKPKTKLGERMIKCVGEAVNDVEAILFVVEACKDLREDETELLKRASLSGAKVILVVNKIDTVENKEKLIGFCQSVLELCEFESVFYVSAKEKDGIDELIRKLEGMMPDSPFFFPEEYYSNEPERFIVSEIIREKLLLNMRDEIPHGTAVSIEKMREREGKDIIDIDADVYCEKSSHKGMIIGKGGAMLKKIGSEARKDIEEFLDCKINLRIWVKVKDDWRNKEGAISSFGM